MCDHYDPSRFHTSLSLFEFNTPSGDDGEDEDDVVASGILIGDQTKLKSSSKVYWKKIFTFPHLDY